MKRLLPFFTVLIFLCFGMPAQAQFTAVSGQVMDSNSSLYSSCQMSITFVPSPTATQIPTLGSNGQTFQTQFPLASCDSFGNFSDTLADNNLVVDGHTGGQASQWVFRICTAPGAFNPQLCFSYTGTITGTSVSLTSTLQPLAPILPVFPSNAALKPLPSDGIQYVSSNGKDTNDGLSQGSAKLTNAAACGALPGGNSSCSTGAGVVWIAPGFTGTVLTPSASGVIVMDWRSGTLVVRGPSAASINLSNGSTGTGAVVLGTVPTIADPALNGFSCFGVQSYSSTHTLLSTDCWVNVTGTTPITASHALTGQRWHVHNAGTGVVTITPDSGTINGVSSVQLSANQDAELTCDGTNCEAGISQAGNSPFNPNVVTLFDDFVGGTISEALGWTQQTSPNCASGCSITPQVIGTSSTSYVGTIGIQTNTTAGGADYLTLAALTTGGNMLNPQVNTFNLWWRVENQNGAGTIRAGTMQNRGAADPAYGLFFEFDAGINGNNDWWCVQESANTRNTVDSGISTNSQAWHTLEIIANGTTTVGWKIDGSTVCGSITTADVPNQGSDPSLEAVTSISSPAQVDADYFRMDFTTTGR